MASFLKQFVSNMKTQMNASQLDKIQLNLWYYVTQYLLLDDNIEQTKAFLEEGYHLIDTGFDFTVERVTNQLLENVKQFSIDEVDVKASAFQEEAALFVPVFIRAYLRSSQSKEMFEQLCQHLQRLAISVQLEELVVEFIKVDYILFGFTAQDKQTKHEQNKQVMKLAHYYVNSLLNDKRTEADETLSDKAWQRKKNYYIFPTDHVLVKGN